MQKLKTISRVLLGLCLCTFLAMLLIPVQRPEPAETDDDWMLEFADIDENGILTQEELDALFGEDDDTEDDDTLTEEELREILGDEFFDTMPEAQEETTTVVPNTGFTGFIDTTPTFDTSIDCMICGGDGRKPCTFCGGTGSTSSTNYGTDFGFGSSSYQTSSSCRTCGGTREVFCTDCGGDGQIG